MTIQQRINGIESDVKKLCQSLPAEAQEKVLGAIRELGYQWQNANATGRVMEIAAGMIAKGVTFDDLEPGTDLNSFCDEGTSAIFNVLPLPVYSALQTEILTETMGGLEDESL